MTARIPRFIQAQWANGNAGKVHRLVQGMSACATVPYPIPAHYGPPRNRPTTSADLCGLCFNATNVVHELAVSVEPGPMPTCHPGRVYRWAPDDARWFCAECKRLW